MQIVCTITIQMENTRLCYILRLTLKMTVMSSACVFYISIPYSSNSTQWRQYVMQCCNKLSRMILLHY